MKGKLLLYLIFSIGLFLVSCSDDDNPTNQGANPSEISAKINGESWLCSDAEAKIIGSSNYVITGAANDGTMIILNFTETSVGTHSGNQATYRVTTMDNYISIGFDYTITEFNESSQIIKGTFDFTGIDLHFGNEDKEITNGKFNVKITN